MSSFRSRRLRENRQYHRTQVTIMTGSKWRFRNRGGRQDLMLSTYQISRCNTSLKYGQAYVDKGMQYYEERHRYQQVEHLKKTAAKLGLQIVEIQPTEA